MTMTAKFTVRVSARCMVDGTTATTILGALGTAENLVDPAFNREPLVRWYVELRDAEDETIIAREYRVEGPLVALRQFRAEVLGC